MNATCPRCSSHLFPSGRYFACGSHTCSYREVRQSFEIPECNLVAFRTQIDALAKRARRLHVSAPSIEMGDPIERRLCTVPGWPSERYDWERKVLIYPVTVRGEAPKIAGWSFVATVDHDGEENIIRAVGDVDGMPAEYRVAAPTCDHCRLKRTRTETFILQHEDGRFSRVGRSCLKDFLGHDNPGALAAAAEFLAIAMGAARDLSDPWGDGDGRYWYPDTGMYLAYVSAAIRDRGWCSRKDEDIPFRIASSTLAWLWISEKDASKRIDPSDDDRATARLALTWAAEIGADGSEVSDFDHNLRAAAKRGAVTPKNKGITAYIVQGYLRSKAKELESRASEYLGEVGLRFGGKGKKALPAIECTVTRVHECIGDFGPSYINILRTDAGNAVVWKTSICLTQGARYRVVGTVKSHEEYRGMKQTKITRGEAEKIETAAVRQSAA